MSRCRADIISARRWGLPVRSGLEETSPPYEMQLESQGFTLIDITCILCYVKVLVCSKAFEGDARIVCACAASHTAKEGTIGYSEYR